MNRIVELTKKYFKVDEQKLAECGGAHHFCLNCHRCRRPFVSKQLYDGTENISSYIDHTYLKPDANEASIKQLCKEAKEFGFKAVCVNPFWVSKAVSLTDFKITKVCTVIGFPLGANTRQIKEAEIYDSALGRADEVDVVINIANLKDKKIGKLVSEIKAMTEICKDNELVLKIIIEACLLTEEEKILACLAAKKGGADFVKTSTGFSTGGATVEDIALIREVVGPYMGVKASGGISHYEQAVLLLKNGANRIGTSKGVEIMNQHRDI